jgi:hypothetical protein
MRTVSVLLLLMSGLTACSGSAVEPVDDPALPAGGALTATVITTEASAAASIDVRFENTGVQRYRFNPCERGVERLEAGGWVMLPPELRLCTADAFALNPGTTNVYRSDVPVDASAGTYRFLFPVTEEAADGQRVLVVSTTFRVR